MIRSLRALAGLALALAAGPSLAAALVETPVLAGAVADGRLPPVAERVPETPLVTDMAAIGKEPGRPGGEIRWIARRARDSRIMKVYGYARLVAYTPEFELAPDILERVEVDNGRIFTLYLRPGHRWSDGEPFTTADFAYYWYDIALNDDLKPYGPDPRLLVNGEPPNVQVLDETTIRYSWSAPNPEFLPALAGALPLYIVPKNHLPEALSGADPSILGWATCASFTGGAGEVLVVRSEDGTPRAALVGLGAAAGRGRDPSGDGAGDR